MSKIKNFKLFENTAARFSADVKDVFIDLLDFGFEVDSTYEQLNKSKFDNNENIIHLTLKKKIVGAFGYIDKKMLFGSSDIDSLKNELDQTIEHLSYIKSKLEGVLECEFTFDFEISCDDNYQIWLYFRIVK